MNQDPEHVLRDAAKLTGLAGGLVSLVCAAIVGVPLALGVAVGALFGWVNLWLLARTLQRALAHPEQAQGRFGVPGALLKWPVVLLALFVVFRFTPARPEGVVLGLLLALASASIAAARTPPNASPPAS